MARGIRTRQPSSSPALTFAVVLTTLVCVIQKTWAAETRYYDWEVEYTFWSPDCKEGSVMAINGQFPGPTIRAVAGDTIVVNLTNKLSTEGLVIHWHGIRQFGTPWADGAAGLSQCAIKPGESFTYKFTVDKAGTYFYHGHYGMQRSAGLYGSLIVDVAKGEKEPFHYDGEFNLLLSDWWHESINSQEIGLSSIPFRWIGEPQSILINGRGQFNCSLAAHFSNDSTSECKFREGDQCAPQILHVEPKKIYRIRIASTTSLASLNFAIGGHKLLVVEADGNYVQPFAADDIDIYSGETYSVLLVADQNPSDNYWISIGVRGRKPNTPPALTMLNYITTPSTKLPSSPPPVTPRWNDFDRSRNFSKKILARMGSRPPPKSSNRRVILLNTQSKINGHTKWAINNVTLSVPATPYLGAIKYKLRVAYNGRSPPRNFPAEYDIMKPPVNPNSTFGNGIYVFPYKNTVDVILQNANALNPNASEIHPWHLHGHDFWVLGLGEGKFRPGIDDKTAFNLKNPPLRNTAVLYPYGWTALRFVTDNPGVWFFHCHIEPHLHMGMGVVFAEGVNRLGMIPDEALGCGLTGKFLMTKHNH